MSGEYGLTCNMASGSWCLSPKSCGLCLEDGISKITLQDLVNGEGIEQVARHTDLYTTKNECEAIVDPRMTIETLNGADEPQLCSCFNQSSFPILHIKSFPNRSGSSTSAGIPNFFSINPLMAKFLLVVPILISTNSSSLKP